RRRGLAKRLLADRAISPYSDRNARARTAAIMDLSRAAESAAAGSRFQPVEFVAGPLDSGVAILCDHASNALPPAYGDLGLPPGAFARHIAYDIGAAWLARRLAKLLDAPAVLSTF